ncbi:MAG TPA: hypothetical protein VFY74_03805, partial [Methyloceanibacter sp.]|nr:hypothetical protein [Methyloceanibacter sp.]
AYVFIIIALARVVGTSWRGGDPEAETRTSRADRVCAGLLLLGFVAATLAVAGSALAASQAERAPLPSWKRVGSRVERRRGEGAFDDGASRLTPHRAPNGARALPQGESGNGHAGENIAG